LTAHRIAGHGKELAGKLDLTAYDGICTVRCDLSCRYGRIETIRSACIKAAQFRLLLLEEALTLFALTNCAW
jgi:hypothetical protein